MDPIFQSICQSPADDTLRRIHADWLEEHGQWDRANFVRLQLADAVHRLEEPYQNWSTPERLEEQRLLREYQLQWRRELPCWPGIEWGSFERGWMEWIKPNSVATFRENAAEIIERTPSRSLFFHKEFNPVELEQLLICPELGEMRALNLNLDFCKIGFALGKIGVLSWNWTFAKLDLPLAK